MQLIVVCQCALSLSLSLSFTHTHTHFVTYTHAADGGVSVCSMLYCTSLLALVGAGDHPAFSPRKLKVFNTKTQTSICELNFVSSVLAVQMNKKRWVLERASWAVGRGGWERASWAVGRKVYWERASCAVGRKVDVCCGCVVWFFQRSMYWERASCAVGRMVWGVWAFNFVAVC